MLDRDRLDRSRAAQRPPMHRVIDRPDRVPTRVGRNDNQRSAIRPHPSERVIHDFVQARELERVHELIASDAATFTRYARHAKHLVRPERKSSPETSRDRIDGALGRHDEQ